MFYSQFILAKKGPLGTIWIAAHLERKLRKNQVADTDIGVSVDSIIFPEVPIALRLSSHLMLGVVRIYSRKVNYLFHDCSEALLKIKQAFRSTAVDLPPEESTAPYHSITLPETFHLDDFELPEAAFQGDIDHHVSTKEQITLQDNPERTGYSTSQFGLDERFGDGHSSHLGLDLEEELMLNKDHSIQLESDDGIIIQGRSSVHLTDMDVDDNRTKDESAEGYSNMDGGPSSHNKLNLLNADDLVGNSVPNWNGYNVQTPDLNDMLLHNEGDAGPSASYYQPSPFPCDEPTSPEFVSAQAPATPGLMEETVPSRVHESPVPSPQQKASPSSNDETSKADNSVAPPSDFLHSAAANANDDVVRAEMTDLGLAKSVQVESSGAVEEIATENLAPQVEISNLEATVDKSVINTDNIAASGGTVAVKASMEGVPLVENTSEPCTDGSTKPSVIENSTQFNEESVDVQGDNLYVSNAMVPSADFQQNIEAIPQELASNDRPNDLPLSEFPEREKMLSAPDFESYQANDLGQITAEKGITESDGSNKIGSLTSRKRHLEYSLPAPESGTTEKLSSRPRGKRTTDVIPDDDDLLASILVGRRTPGLGLGSTPLPPKASSLKRPRLASKTATPKRKVQTDDAMVIHADTIRQQLISTEDIRRIRKKAPCTRSEIWMIEKGSLEDNIFHEPVFSCICKELNDLHYRNYETVAHLTVQSMELQGRLDMSETIEADSNKEKKEGRGVLLGGRIRSRESEMDFELRQAREKLEREQRERVQRAKAKADRERRARAEAARRRDALEASHRERRLDAARAQEEAEQKMEEVMQLGKGISFSCMFEALRYDGPGDKIKLPPSSFKELSDEGALDKGPMYFRLSKVTDRVPGASQDQDAKEATCCGVLEFTAREGSAELPPHVWNNLFQNDSLDVPLIEVRYVSLPKGTYAKLKPEGVGFSDLPNHRAVLETALRNHATLSENDVVLVNYGQLQYRLKVLELKPSSSVSVLETDVEVDIEGPDSVLDNEENQHVLVPLEIGKVESGVVEEGKFRYYKFSVEEGMSEKVASACANIEVKIEADTNGGDTDIYVSRHPLVFPTQHRHEWSSHEMGCKVLILKPRDASLVSGTYSIGVYGFKGTAKYQLSVAIKDVINSQRIGEQASASSSADVDSVLCKNCKRHISSRTSLLHEAYCVRHNVACMHDGCGVVLRKEEAADHVHCNKCGQAFQQREMEKHMKVFHEPLHCPCGVVLEKEDMVQHQSSNCPLRLIVCRFCGDTVHAGGEPLDARDRLRNMCEHESICGSRTAPCDSCGRSVMLKDMDIHVIAVHQKS